MQRASAASVEGDFNGTTLTEGGASSRFFKRDGKFMVRTQGSDGKSHDYPVSYAFGISPLQQYLVELPGGRLQALGLAWDTRPRSVGGQRWFSLYFGQKISPENPLFWAGLNQNWNFMCADCHSTNVRRSYHGVNRSFTTSYAAINVACEACHGPGSRHAGWASTRRNHQAADASDDGLLIRLDERRNVKWRILPSTGNAVRSRLRTSAREIEMCARCHSRRTQIHEDYVHGQSVGDDYRVALLDPGLYFSDGQIDGEVYEYGSFIQSRMYHAGVTCSDCHDPHSLQLRAQGNALCARCHDAKKYDTAEHHMHRAKSPGAQCVDCHMPARTYMAIDERRDHSLRIPRPELTVELGVPNACNGCHRDKSADWAAHTIRQRYGRDAVGFQRFGPILRAGADGSPGASRKLAELAADLDQPAIARATALALLDDYPGLIAVDAARAGAHDASPLVRRAAADALRDAKPRVRAALLAPLLHDNVRTVRLEAAEVLAGASSADLPDSAARALHSALDEYVAAQNLNADRPEAHLNLASVFIRENRLEDAQAELQVALALDPLFAPAAVNLADLDRQRGDDAQGERVLRAAIGRTPASAPLEHALGLLLVRQGHREEALARLANAQRLDPTNAQFALAYGLALADDGHIGQAIAVLEGSVARLPYDRDSLAALANLYQTAGDSAGAASCAKRLATLNSDP